ncbi:MAG: hypothetical protein ABIN89_26460 [Chitinophagaceae bacterium]
MPLMFRLFVILVLSGSVSAMAQKQKSENVIVVTLDGVRWLEAMKGADSSLFRDDKTTTKFRNTLQQKYWAPSPGERRKKLMPFLWSEFEKNGRIYGNRDYGNNVQVKNPYNVSVPGYAEIYTGYADTAIKSNELIPNPNPNLFEYLNKQPGFEKKVAAFVSWNAADYYLNEARSGYLVNCGYEKMTGKLSPMQERIDEMIAIWPRTVSSSSRSDIFTYEHAREYIQLNHPRALGIGFAYTDDYSHSGEYAFCLEQIHAFDTMINQLWEFVQSDPFYKDKTTLLLTVDHGRGFGPAWTSHGPTVEHSNEIWFAVMGPGITPLGEMKNATNIYQNQFAQTIAHTLGLEFKSSRETGKVIDELFTK